MRGFTGYLLIGGVAVLASGLATVADLGLAVGARPMQEAGAIIQHVDRRQKGDRLDIHTTIGSHPIQKARITVPIGCEPAFSPLVSSGHPSISGHCVS